MKQSQKQSNKKINNPKIVVIGGGTGSSVVLSGLKTRKIDVSAIITVADSGGSTGRLRDEFGFLPVGDLRQSLASLAYENDQSWIRELLLYRFSKGKGLSGHNLGNLILTALQDLAGSTPKALDIAGKVFRLDGKIYPSTLENVQLVTTYSDGVTKTGEHHLDSSKSGGKQITSIRLKPEAKVYPKAKEAILSSDLVVIGPGDLYGSILPNIIIKGIAKALNDTSAKVVYIVNLMTRFAQTHNMTARDHVETLSAYMGKMPDHIIINTGKIPRKFLAQYKKEHEFPVLDNLEKTPGVVRGDFVSQAPVKLVKGDRIRRTHLRHDQDKLTNKLITLLK